MLVAELTTTGTGAEALVEALEKEPSGAALIVAQLGEEHAKGVNTAGALVSEREHVERLTDDLRAESERAAILLQLLAEERGHVTELVAELRLLADAHDIAVRLGPEGV